MTATPAASDRSELFARVLAAFDADASAAGLADDLADAAVAVTTDEVVFRAFVAWVEQVAGLDADDVLLRSHLELTRADLERALGRPASLERAIATVLGTIAIRVPMPSVHDATRLGMALGVMGCRSLTALMTRPEMALDYAAAVAHGGGVRFEDLTAEQREALFDRYADLNRILQANADDIADAVAAFWATAPQYTR